MKKIAKKYLKLLGFEITRGYNATAPIPELAYFDKLVPKEIQLTEGTVLKCRENTRLINDENYYQVLFDSSDVVFLSEKDLNNEDLFRDPVETCLQVKLFNSIEELNLFLEENHLKSECDVRITNDNRFLLKYLRIGDEYCQTVKNF